MSRFISTSMAKTINKYCSNRHRLTKEQQLELLSWYYRDARERGNAIEMKELEIRREHLDFNIGPFMENLHEIENSTVKNIFYRERKQWYEKQIQHELTIWAVKAGLVDDNRVDSKNPRYLLNQKNVNVADYLVSMIAFVNFLNDSLTADPRIPGLMTTNANPAFVERFAERIQGWLACYQALTPQKESALHPTMEFALSSEGKALGYKEKYQLLPKTLVEARKRLSGKWKSIGYFVGLFIALGPCLLAAGEMQSNAIVFGLAGFFSNAFLYTYNVPTCLENFFVSPKSIFQGLDDSPWYTSPRKLFILGTTLFALLSGLSFAALTGQKAIVALAWTQSAITWLPFAWATTIAPMIPIVLTVGFCAFMCIGLTSLYFNSAVNMLKLTSADIRHLWLTLYARDHNSHWMAYGVKLILNTLLPLGGLFVGVVAGVALCGVMQVAVSMLLLGIGLSNSSAFIGSVLVAFVFNGPMRLLFSVKSNVSIAMFISNDILYPAFTRCGELVQQLQTLYRTMPARDIFISLFALTTIVANGIAMGSVTSAKAGVRAINRLLNWVQVTLSTQSVDMMSGVSSGAINTYGMLKVQQNVGQLERQIEEPYLEKPSELQEGMRLRLFGGSKSPYTGLLIENPDYEPVSAPMVC